jgi:predicted LPLAT superfamily acyltransferase
MPEWQGKSKGSALGYRIFVFVCRKLGVRPAYVLLRFVSFYYFLFSWSSSRHVYDYFRNRLGYTAFSSFFKIYTNYYKLGQTLIDKMMVMAGIGESFTYDFDGEENLRDMVARGRGGILLSAHVGNWEAAGHLLRRLNTRINVVMYDGEHQAIKQYLDQLTGGRNFNVIVIRDNMSHVYEMGDVLARNELICMHADRFLPGNKTLVRTFLGSPAHFPEGPFALAAAFRVPVSFVFAFKESATHYHFFGSQLYEWKGEGSKAEFRDRLAGAFVAEVEQKVRLYPVQWFNYYNFWTGIRVINRD